MLQHCRAGVRHVSSTAPTAINSYPHTSGIQVGIGDSMMVDFRWGARGNVMTMRRTTDWTVIGARMVAALAISSNGDEAGESRNMGRRCGAGPLSATAQDGSCLFARFRPR